MLKNKKYLNRYDIKNKTKDTQIVFPLGFGWLFYILRNVLSGSVSSKLLKTIIRKKEPP